MFSVNQPVLFIQTGEVGTVLEIQENEDMINCYLVRYQSGTGGVWHERWVEEPFLRTLDED